MTPDGLRISGDELGSLLFENKVDKLTRLTKLTSDGTNPQGFPC